MMGTHTFFKYRKEKKNWQKVFEVIIHLYKIKLVACSTATHISLTCMLEMEHTMKGKYVIGKPMLKYMYKKNKHI